MIGQTLSHYQIVKRIGTGGMGEVYLAEDLQLGRKVALKMLPAKFTKNEAEVRRFEQEARAASALNHPNIITIHEIGKVEGVHFIATEYIDGETLKQLMAKRRLTLNEVIDIALQVMGALAAAHPAGIVHRDIKPANIMVRRDGYVKILDFGLAKFTERQIGSSEESDPSATLSVDSSSTSLLSSSSSSSSSDVMTDNSPISNVHTHPGAIMGTPKYMSPEQTKRQPVDARTDIFSLAVVLYEMIAGKVPFEAPTINDLLNAISSNEPLPLTHYVPDIPPELQQTINKALEKELDDRYSTIQDMLSDWKNLKQRLTFEAELKRIGEQPITETSGAQPILDTIMQLAARSSSDIAVLRPSTDTSVSGSLTGESRRRRRGTIAATVALILLLFGAISYSLFWSRSQDTFKARNLAILPFRNLKPDTETDFLGFSLADAIITKLGYVSALIVRPSSAIDKYRNQMLDA
ncbi:MAG: serine/threonine-protein kinase, partial [Acidobacteriota bacterium]